MNFQVKPKWVSTVVENQLGPLTFTVRLSDRRLWKRHQDHLRERRPDKADAVDTEQQQQQQQQQQLHQQHHQQQQQSVVQLPVVLPESPAIDAKAIVSTRHSASTAEGSESNVADITATESATPILVASSVRRSNREVKVPIKLNL